MAVDLGWHDACSAAGVFTKEQEAAGWPADMTPDELAALQRPHARGDAAGRKAKWALGAALKAACKAGEIACTTETKPVQRNANIFEPIPIGAGDFGNSEWKSRAFRREW